MTKDEQAFLFEHIFLHIRLQRFVPRHTKKETPVVDPIPDDPVIAQYNNGLISKAEICRYLQIEEKHLLRTLVEKGQLFTE